MDKKTKILTISVVILTVASLVAYKLIVGTISIKVPLKSTTIFIDKNKKILTSKDNEVVKVSLFPGEHGIIVSGQDTFPWAKDIDLSIGEDMTLSPILVSKSPAGSIITNKDPEYQKIRSEVRQNVLPSKTNPLKSKDGSTEIWIENNTVIAKIGDKTHTVIAPETPIRNLSFYKDRADAIIFSADKSIYVIETEISGIQNFMPIYEGHNPIFALTNENSLYVLDNELLMQVAI